MKNSDFCIYTTLIGDYEKLNEQPFTLDTKVPFICFTDNRNLQSKTWQIKPIEPLFEMDLIRSQREIKILSHRYLPEYNASIYIDNSVVLFKPPELIFEKFYNAETGFSVPKHSFRNSITDEFIEILKLNLEDPIRVFEQLNHYSICCPDILDESPYWTGILLRNHRHPIVCKMLEIWCSHVHRYSRRDQLSLNYALKKSGLKPNQLELDNFFSFFHSWPHGYDRRAPPPPHTRPSCCLNCR